MIVGIKNMNLFVYGNQGLVNELCSCFLSVVLCRDRDGQDTLPKVTMSG